MSSRNSKRGPCEGIDAGFYRGFNKKHPVSRIVVLLASFIIISSCGGAKSASPNSGTQSAGASGLRLVALGDSLPYGGGYGANSTAFPAIYGRNLQQATGRHVTVLNDSKHTGLNSTGLLTLVRTDQSIRSDIASADAVLVTIGHNDTPWILSDDPCDGAASDKEAQWSRYNTECIRPLTTRLRNNLDAVLTEISTLRTAKPTLIRVTNFHNDSEKDPTVPPGGDKISRSVVDAYSAAICAGAQKHHVPCADIYHAFNGPNGDQFDGVFVEADHVHPSPRGQAEIAMVLSRLGYSPLA